MTDLVLHAAAVGTSSGNGFPVWATVLIFTGVVVAIVVALIRRR